MKKIIDHIVADNRKSRRTKTNRIILSVYLPIAALFLGLLLRPDQIGLDEPLFWLFGGTHLVLVAVICYTMLMDLDVANKKYRLIWVLSTILLIALSLRPGTFGFEFDFINEYQFYIETKRCFIYAFITVFVSGALIYRLESMVSQPDSRLVFALSMLPAYTALAMLNIHCLSDDFKHIFISHWLPGLAFFIPMALFWSWLIKRKHKKLLL